MKRIAIFCLLFLPVVASAQKQYYLPTAGASDDEKDKPMIEVYLPQQPNGCAVVLCPGGAMRWLSWESDVAKIVQQSDNIELYRQLINLSEQALDQQNTINHLHEEVERLKKILKNKENIQRHPELYLTLENNSDVIYCSHCWDNEEKLIQMKIVNGQYECPHCKTKGVFDKNEYEMYKEKKNPLNTLRGL